MCGECGANERKENWDVNTFAEFVRTVLKSSVRHECLAKERKEDGVMKLFQENVATELLNARAKYRPMASAHEGWAVLREEVDELWDEIRKKPAQRDIGAMYHELAQIAAMAQRMAEDVCDSGKAVEL
jgi:hypothetical protein